MVELLVSLTILVTVMAASASALIGFAQTALQNERRVQATAQLTAYHERLQGIPWQRTAVYENEVEALHELNQDRIADPDAEALVPGLEYDETDGYTLDGEPLVLLPGPDETPYCEDPFDPQAGNPSRLDYVPCAYVEELVVDDRSYEVVQLVSEFDRSGDGDADLRRFTTIVSWEVRDRTFSQTFVSERAPTNSETASLEAPPIRQFLVTPEPVQTIVHDPSEAAARLRNDEAIHIAARFGRGVLDAEVCFLPRAEFMEDGVDTFDPDTFDPATCGTSHPLDGEILDDGGLHSGFERVLSAHEMQLFGSDLVAEFVATGRLAVKAVLIGDEGGGEYLVTDADIELTDLDMSSAPPAPIFGASDLWVGSTYVDANQEICTLETVRVNADVSVADGEVQVYFSDRSRGLAAPDSSSGDWVTVFEDGAVAPWQPRPGNDIEDIFYATASTTMTFTVDGEDVEVFRTSPYAASQRALFQFAPGGNC